MLNTCNDLSLRDGQVTWQEVLQLSREPKGRIPMATFTRIVQSLQRYKPRAYYLSFMTYYVVFMEKEAVVCVVS